MKRLLWKGCKLLYLEEILCLTVFPFKYKTFCLNGLTLHAILFKIYSKNRGELLTRPKTLSNAGLIFEEVCIKEEPEVHSVLICKI